MLIYGILFVSEVLGKIKPGMSKREAEKVRYNFFYMTMNYLEKDGSASA